MNGHDRRKQRIIDRIKRSALELFSAYGENGVSMDEIAARADVSKVTIYKYFESKEQLRREIVDLFVDEIMAATEQLFDSDLDFLEKLKLTMKAQVNTPRVADANVLFEMLEKDIQAGVGKAGSLNARIEEVKRRFYEQGKKEGYINENVSIEVASLYGQIFQAGFQVLISKQTAALTDPLIFEQLLHLFFFGIVRQPVKTRSQRSSETQIM